MIYCKNCGKGIAEDSKFCTNCGAAVSAEPLTAPKDIPPSPPLQSPAPIPPGIQPLPSFQSQADRKPNTFYSDAGFWGAILLLVGFFLPFYTSLAGMHPVDISLSEMASSADNKIAGLLLFMVPLSAIVVIIHGLLRPFPPAIPNIFKILPLLLMVFCLGAVLREDETGSGISALFKIGRPGLYVTLLGALLILAFRSRR